MEKNFWVIEFCGGYGVTLQRAKYDEEKGRYAEAVRDYMMVSLGEQTKLENLNPYHDTPNRKADGMFNGCNGRVYIITEAEREQYIALNAEKGKKEAIKEMTKEMESIEETLTRAENGKIKIYATEQEAKAARKRYNDLHNEGGTGYVPHFWHKSEIDSLRARATSLRQKLDNLNNTH